MAVTDSCNSRRKSHKERREQRPGTQGGTVSSELEAAVVRLDALISCVTCNGTPGHVAATVRTYKFACDICATQETTEADMDTPTTATASTIAEHKLSR
eukprot:6463437-Amphidinium_carterae.2